MPNEFEGCWCCKKRDKCLVDVERCFNYEVDKKLLEEDESTEGYQID